MTDINYNVPPVDVKDWTEWYKLWALANRFNLLAGKDWQGATDAETAQNLITIINNALNGATSGSIIPVVKQGSTLLPAVSQNAQAIIAVTPTDPANVGTISAQPLEGIVTGGGSIGAVLGTVAGGSYGTVKKTVAVLSVASILATTIGAFQMAQEKIEDLFFAVDPYVDENDNVMTYTDENGKTYLPHDFIEAIRQKLIEMGAYDTEEHVVPNTSTQPQTFSEGDNMQSNIFFVKDMATRLFSLATDDGNASDYQYAYDLLNSLENNYAAEINSFGRFRTLMVTLSKGSNDAQRHITVTATGINPTYDSFIGTLTKSTSPLGDYYSYSSGSNVSLPVHIWRVRKNGQIQSFSITTSGAQNAAVSGVTLTERNQNDYYTGGYGGVGELVAGGGVEGITIQDGATVPSDPNQTLEDYFPAWTGEGKVFNTVTLGADRAIQSIGHTTFLPATLKDVQPFEEGTTQDQTQAQAGTPQENPDITNSLLPAIQEFIETIINSPDIPTPTIPAGDSGDTPPENPPLTPPSDATGSNGLWSIYNPSLQNVNDFGAWLWSDSLADQFKRVFNSPIDGVIGFHMLYCTPSTGTAKPIKCGFLQSPVAAPVVTNPYVEINCGTVSIGEYYGNALDYDNTRISVYLPFVGIVPLDTNIVMGSDINITYRVDVLTGTCLAQIKVLKENSDAVMYAFDGNCAVQIPLTATTYTGMIGALLGGISAGASIMTGNMVQAIGSGMRALASGMTGLSGAKQSGTFGANVGALGIRIPYVIITHPVSAMPYQFNKLEGLPSNTAVTLGSLSGFTRVRSVHLENIGNATQEEIQMIQEQLEQGVII